MDDPPVRLLLAGTVDFDGAAATVAGADPEGVFREVRLVARQADLAVVMVARGDTGGLLAAAGFDAALCPQARALPSAPAALPIAGPEVRLICAAAVESAPGAADWSPFTSVRSLTLTAVEGPVERARGWADVLVALSGDSPTVRVEAPPLRRPRLVVSGLGLLLSAEAAPGGAVLEVLADDRGVIAYRLGRVAHPDFRVRFLGWDLPAGDAALLDGEWWALARPVVAAAVRRPPTDLAFTPGDLTAAALGDVTGDGELDLAAAYRHPLRPSALSEARPGIIGVDSRGRSAHLGIFTPGGEAIWAAGYIPRPVGNLAACDGSVALAYTDLDDPAVVATGAAVWQGLGLHAAPDLPGPGIPGCTDVDRDGALDPVVLARPG
jgi:hypothetical protein